MQWKENLWKELRWECYFTICEHDQEQQRPELNHQNRSPWEPVWEISFKDLRKKYKLIKVIKTKL